MVNSFISVVRSTTVEDRQSNPNNADIHSLGFLQFHLPSSQSINRPNSCFHHYLRLSQGWLHLRGRVLRVPRREDPLHHPQHPHSGPMQLTLPGKPWLHFFHPLWPWGLPLVQLLRSLLLLRHLALVLGQRWANSVLRTEYEYEYYSVAQKWPNTNTNIIRFPKNDRIRIRILFRYPEMTEYEYKYHSAYQ